MTTSPSVAAAPGPSAFQSVPVIDLGPLLGGEPGGEAMVAAAIGAACREVGFFYVANHGVPQALIDQVFERSHAFFARPLAEKMAIAIERSPNHRGYFPIGGENVDPENAVDLKEGFDMALELGPEDADVRAGKPLHGPNQWPADAPEFRAALDAYYGALSGLGRTLCRAFAIALDLPATFFDDKLTKPLAQLRLLHYPPQPIDADARTIGAGAHTDYGCVAMLYQDATGGLELRNANGAWIAAPPIPGTFVCNIGDMMARWTNDRFAATYHRVVNRSGRDRYSVVLFFDPDFDVEVACLPGCRAPGEPPRYPPTTCGRHVLERFAETFVYRQG